MRTKKQTPAKIKRAARLAAPVVPPPLLVDGVSLRRSVSNEQHSRGVRGELELTDSKGTTMTFDLTERGLQTIRMTTGG